MKIQYKLLLIFILFSIAFLLNNTKSFAYNYEGQEVPNLPKNTYNSEYFYMFRNPVSGNLYLLYISRDLRLTTNKETIKNSNTYDDTVILFYARNCYYQWYYLRPNSSSWQEHIKGYASSDKLLLYSSNVYNRLVYSNNVFYYSDTDFIFEDNDPHFDELSSVLPTGSIEDYYKAYLGLYKGVYIPYKGAEPDKLNLYELNMTDLDDNRKKHKFNLATYTNSPCYDELMNYYNSDYQYAIYLTDYERILTYQNYDDDNSFLYGSYVISGYIDYLITDKAFFYYSEYYNQVLSNSGTSVFNKNVEDYTKRFYFKLTYSEDSDDPHAEIWEDNGNLYKIDYLKNFEDRYRIGFSQTIYYAEEDLKGNFKGLTDNIYYLGYLDLTGGATRDISETPFYVYNFDYAGGSTELYVVNQSDYNYEEMINSRYNNWQEHYDEWTILTDGSIGGSYIQGNDLTSSTYRKGDVKKDTAIENAQNHIGEISTAFGDKEIIDKQKETEEGVKDGTLITDTVNKIKDKFSFSDNLVNNANEIKDFITNTQETHKYYLTINHKYLSGSVCVIDLSWYAPYKSTVDAFICAFAYLSFIWHMFCRIPNLINGASASSYVSDISTYMNKKGG